MNLRVGCRRVHSRVHACMSCHFNVFTRTLIFPMCFHGCLWFDEVSHGLGYGFGANWFLVASRQRTHPARGHTNSAHAVGSPVVQICTCLGPATLALISRARGRAVFKDELQLWQRSCVEGVDCRHAFK